MLKKTMNGKPLIYLDTAATAQKPNQVIDALCHFYRECYGTINRAVYEMAARATEMYASARVKVQQFINARFEEEIVFTSGTTASINLVAHTFARAFLKPGDEILITEMEHHSNIIPWQLIAEQYGIILKVAPLLNSGEIDLDAFKELLSEKTKLVSVVHISNATGIVNPIETLTSLAHEKGAKILVDGAQAISHLPIDVQALNVDFYAFSGHKLYGPTGVGILYGNKAVLEKLPPFMGGGDMIDQVSFDGSTFQPPPYRFEAGTPPVAQVIGLSAAIDYVTEIGMDKIHVWEQKLLHYAHDKMEKIAGLRIYGDPAHKSGLISFTIKDMHTLDLGTLLGLKGIAIRTGHICAQPAMKRFGIETLARVSFGLYNTYEEIDVFLHALKESIVLLKPEMSY